MDQSPREPFDQLPPTVRGHFLLHFYAAVHCLLLHLERLSRSAGRSWDDLLRHYPFVAGYLAEIQRVLPDPPGWGAGAEWWEPAIRAWEERVDTHLPLRAIDTLTDGSFAQRLALLLIGLVDEDSRFGTLFADMQAPLPRRRPCAETLAQILAGGGADPGGSILCRPLLRAGLAEPLDPAAPRSEWVLCVPAPLWDVLRGIAEQHPAPWCTIHRPEDFPAIDELIFAPELLRRLAQVPRQLRARKSGALVVRGIQGSGQLDVLGAVARALGRGVLHVTPAAHPGSTADLDERQRALLGPLCTLANCLPALTYDLAPGESVEPPLLPGYVGPVGVLLGMEGGLRGTRAAHALTLTLPPPGVELRLRHWQRTLGAYVGPDLPTIAARFALPGEYIRQLGTLAIDQAALDDRETVCMGDVRTAARTLNRQLLDSLATHLDVAGRWEQLIVSSATAARLRELELRCRHRERLLSHLGPAFDVGANRGVRALFTGASGTGKTLAAKILAAELGMDLYRVDLSAIVNKYIGETEKNLHRVLARAEELDVILLLDEGDSLLGNRTDVKSANDRYANLETNFLLQRLEHHQGIVLVTTNASQYIDDAFQRRLDVVVNFVPPQAAERWRIWMLHLPVDHAVDSSFLEEVAARCVLTGGQIRNAALHATLLALDTGTAVNRCHVEAAVEGEYRKAGALYPLSEDTWSHEREHRVAALLNVLAS